MADVHTESHQLVQIHGFKSRLRYQNHFILIAQILNYYLQTKVYSLSMMSQLTCLI